MTKLCPRGKAAAKRKFAVYPSAYANAYASKICAGKIKDPSGVKRKDFKGPKPAGKAKGGRIGYREGRRVLSRQQIDRLKELSKSPTKIGPKPNEIRMTPEQREKRFKRPGFGDALPSQKPKPKKFQKPKKAGPSPRLQRPKMMGGGMMQMPRAMYGKGGGVCKRGMNRQAIGKNS